MTTVQRFKVVYSDKDSNEVSASREFTMPQTAKNWAEYLKKEGHTVLGISVSKHPQD